MKPTTWLKAGFAFLTLFFPLSARASTFYVSPTGSDSNTGTEASPFATWAKAQTAVSPGDTVYFRGGTYKYTTATGTCSSTSATVDSVVLNKSGTAGNMINYWAYPGEKPVFDFSGVTDMSKYNCRHSGVRVTGSYLYLKGLELTGVLQLNNLNHESWCLYIFGSYNTFELIDAHHNMGPGIFIQQGGHNTVLNCDSHENEDTMTSNGDGQSADGFGCHTTRAGDTGNVFHGCRAWWNTDDGWDFIHAVEVCTVEYSWSWYHGYKPDEMSGGKPVALSAGNGNGIKAGGYDMPPTGVPAIPPQHVVRFNVSVANKSTGFTANYHPVSIFFYNNTAYNSGTDFNMLGVASDGTASISVGTLRNNLAFAGGLTSSMSLGGPISEQFNSWDASLGLTVTNADFQNVTFTPPASCPAPFSPGGTPCVSPTDMTTFAGMASARKADGSLPDLPFLHLVAGSKLIDKGQDVGLPFVGASPDLGAFEYGATGGSSGGTGGLANGTGGVGSGGIAGGTGGAGSGGIPGGTGGATTGTGGSKAGGVGGGTGGSGSGGVAGIVGSGGSTARTGGASGANSGGATGIGGAGGSASGSGGLGSGAGGSSAGAGGSSAGVGGAMGTGGQSTTSASSGGAGGSTRNQSASSGGCSCELGKARSDFFAPVLFGLLLVMHRLRPRNKINAERTRESGLRHEKSRPRRCRKHSITAVNDSDPSIAPTSLR